MDPQPGEDHALAAEQARLMDLDDLRRLGMRAQEGLSGSETDFDAPSAVALIGEARKSLTHLADRDELARPLAARAVELGMLANDLAAEVAGYLDDLVADPLRLEAVGERRAQLAGLTRKYGATVEEVLGWADDARPPGLAELVGSDERIAGTARPHRPSWTRQLAADAAKISARAPRGRRPSSPPASRRS